MKRLKMSMGRPKPCVLFAQTFVHPALDEYVDEKLREQLDKLLNRKIEEPGLDISLEGQAVVAAVVELLHSQNVRY